MGVVELGEPSRYCCLIRVAHRIILPNILYNKHTTKNKMRAFIILACVGVVIAGDDMFGMKKMQKTWAEHKAMESCFGENVMKTSLLKMKKAVVKCTGMDMPEIELPMYNNPHRFVHALLESSEDLKTMKLFKAMSMMQKGHTQQSQVAPIQLVLGQQQAPQDNMMKKMFMKMMMKKMFHTHENEDDNESPFGNMGSKKYGMDDDSSQYKLFENLMKSMTKTKISMSAAWSNPLKMENGENSKTNGSKNNISRTAVPAQPSLKLSQNLFSLNALMEKNGAKS